MKKFPGIVAAPILAAFAFALIVTPTFEAQAASDRSIGQIKTAAGDVVITRSGKRSTAAVGAYVREGDTVTTGDNGSIGITFKDNTVFSAGPGSEFTFDEFQFDPTSQTGSFVTAAQQGTLSFISGDLVKGSPEALKVKTPMAILGVRGTEFVVKVEPPIE